MRNRNRFPIDIKGIEALSLRPARDIGMKTFARFNQRREHFQLPAPHRTFHLFYDGCYALLLDGKIAVGAELSPRFRKKEPQKMINFRDGGDGGFSPATRNAL